MMSSSIGNLSRVAIGATALLTLALLIAPAATVAQTELIQDRGFEGGTPNPSWDEGSTNFGTPLCTVGTCGSNGGGTGPHGGTWWVWFGGISTLETGFVAQEVTIPATGSAELRFWLEIPAANTPGFLDVSLGGDVLFSVTEADASDYATYTEVVLDVSSYANGGTHDLRFDSTTQAGDEPSDITNFFVDDVSLTVVEGAALFEAASLEVDTTADSSDGNGVFEPGEQVDVVPGWRNDGSLAGLLSGTASDFTGPAGADYTLVDDGADYDEVDPGETATCADGENCYEMGLSDPAVRPATLWEATFEETLDDTDGTTKTWTLHIGDSFNDVPRSSLFYTSIETLLGSGVTGGCGAGDEYCPGDSNTRAQMPVFMLRALMGPDYMPPACDEGNDPFGDVPFDSTFCPWIQDLADRGIVSGCGDGNYCPSAAVTRAQMSIFLLKTQQGADYEPPACSNQFTDVPCPSLFADWIEDLAARDITGGCTATEYCPGDEVTRAQMAAFITNAFGFTLYGP